MKVIIFPIWWWLTEKITCQKITIENRQRREKISTKAVYNFFHQYSIRVFTGFTHTILLSPQRVHYRNCLTFHPLFRISIWLLLLNLNWLYWKLLHGSFSLTCMRYYFPIVAVQKEHWMRMTVNWSSKFKTIWANLSIFIHVKSLPAQ